MSATIRKIALSILCILATIPGKTQQPESDSLLALQAFDDGLTAYRAGRYDTAIVQFQNAAQHHLADVDTSYALYCYKFVGSSLIRLERLRDFLEFRPDILPLLAINDEEVPAVLGLLGSAAINYGDPELAHQYFTQACTRAEELDSASNRIKFDIANLYANQGRLFVMQGDYARAMLNYQHTLAILADSSLPHAFRFYSQAITLSKIGRAYELQGAFETALHYNALVDEILTQHPSTTTQIQNLNNQGIAHRNLHHFEAALACFQKELALQKPTDNKRGRTLKQLGETYLAMGQADIARTYLLRGQVFREAEYGDLPHPNMAKLLTLLGNCDFQQGNFQGAMNWYAKAIARLCLAHPAGISRDLPNAQGILFPLDLLPVLEARGRALEAMYAQNGDSSALRKALNNYKFAEQLQQDVVRSLDFEGSKITLSDQTRPIYEGGIRVALALHQVDMDPAWKNEAFYFAEQNRATLLKEAVRKAGVRNLGIVPDSLWQLQRSLSITLGNLRKDLAKFSPEDIAMQPEARALETQLFKAHFRQDSLARAIETSYPAVLSKYEGDQHIPEAKEFMGLLPAGQALIEYFVGDSMIYALTLTDSEQQLFALGSPTGLRADIDQLRQVTDLDSGGLSAFAGAAHRLYQRLVAPVRAALQGDRLIVVPDGILHLLPFELLLETPGSQASYRSLPYLFRSFAISYQFSCTLMRAKNSQAQAPQGPVSWAGFAPGFSLDRSGLPPLHGARQEVDAVAAFLPEGQKYDGVQASKATFYQTLTAESPPRIVHLACHAKADPKQEAASWIAFSDADTSDFRLGLEEIYHLPAAPAMMVLSACETGAGPLARAEGAMSLARGFYLSGSQSVMNSMWQVRDGSSAFLMEKFYGEMAAGQPLDVALQRAMLAYLDSEDFGEAYMAPHYWAGFRITGAAQPLQAARKRRAVLWMLFGFLATGVLWWWSRLRKAKKA